MATTSKFLAAILCLSACSLGQQTSFADAGFVVYTFVNYENSSQRGLAVAGDIIAISGTEGRVAWSLDGGQSFPERIQLKPELDYRDIEVLGESAIVVMSAGPGEQSTVSRLELQGSKTLIRPPIINQHPEGFWDGIDFWEASERGILVGDPVDGKLTVMLTDDGAQSFRPAANPPQVGNRQYCFAASGTSVVTISKDVALIATGGTESQVWKSVDGGDNWRAIDIPFVHGSNGSGVFSIAFKDEQNGVIVGGDYENPELNYEVAAYTDDGGNTWKSASRMTAGYRSAV
ncbi:MAG: hypothetical protein QGF46_03990, partial [Planctomycetota bacterium]|nr:hypothetical protein [Planctomycetota bacterium]